MQAVGHFLDDQGRSVFRVYAPQHDALALQLANSTHPMQPAADGYWHLTLPRVAEGTRYQFIVEGRAYPDPASRWQPDGVHGASAVVSVPQVNRHGWSGIAIEDAIIYELHLGTFTPEGTLAAAQTRLPHLQALGITVIELMPLATFPGERNWGYDGTYLFALQPSYGNYADLVAFIEAAHGHGIAVILDVVYNHFGPEGNYAGCFAPYTKQADTPWGAAINFDGEHSAGIRDFYLANTRYWLEEIGFDGFRMDAVSLVFDTSPTSILREITNLARTIGEREQRQVLMIAEHLCNDVNVTAANGLAYHSQWNDDLNHALFAFLTGEQGRHYSSFGSFADIVHAMQNSFVLDGTRQHHFYQRLFGTDGRQTAATEQYVREHGINGFYQSVEQRKACCAVRKIEPLKRALAGRQAWITGLRRQQSLTRVDLADREFDADNGLWKFNPLIEWTEAEVWEYLRANDVPYNALHDQHYPSIGCAPCTRAISMGEDVRAGRWWWENPDSKECGLHLKASPLRRPGS